VYYAGVHSNGVATISRLLRIVSLFCKRALQKRRYSAKETYNLKEPTNRSHLMCIYHVRNMRGDHIPYVGCTLHYIKTRSFTHTDFDPQLPCWQPGLCCLGKSKIWSASLVKVLSKGNICWILRSQGLWNSPAPTNERSNTCFFKIKSKPRESRLRVSIWELFNQDIDEFRLLCELGTDTTGLGSITRNQPELLRIIPATPSFSPNSVFACS